MAYYKSIERQFGEQKVDIKTFKNASSQYNLELEKMYKLKYEQKVVKLALENLIGIPLEEALIE